MANVNSLPSGPVAFCARKCVKMEFRPVGNEMGNKRGQGGAYPLGPPGGGPAVPEDFYILFMNRKLYTLLKFSNLFLTFVIHFNMLSIRFCKWSASQPWSGGRGDSLPCARWDLQPKYLVSYIYIYIYIYIYRERERKD